VVRFLLPHRVNSLGYLHQDELALATVFGVQAHDGFGGGAAAGEKVEDNLIFYTS
jgi:hypothetical protein